MQASPSSVDTEMLSAPASPKLMPRRLRSTKSTCSSASNANISLSPRSSTVTSTGYDASPRGRLFSAAFSVGAMEYAVLEDCATPIQPRYSRIPTQGRLAQSTAMSDYFQDPGSSQPGSPFGRLRRESMFSEVCRSRVGRQSKQMSTGYSEGEESDEDGRRIDIRRLSRHLLRVHAPQKQQCFCMKKKLLDFALALTQIVLTQLEVLLVTFRLCYLYTAATDSPLKPVEILLDVLEVCYVLAHLLSPPLTHGVYAAPTLEHTMLYVRTPQFWLDLVMALPTGCVGWAFGSTNALWRVNKLAGVLTFMQRFDTVLQRLSVEYQLSPLVVRLMRQAAVFVTCAHLFSCLWYIVVQKDIEEGISVSAILTLNEYNPVHGWVDGGKNKQRLYLLGFDLAVKLMCGYGVVGGFPQSERQIAIMLAIAMVGISLFALFLGTVTTFVSEMAMNNASERLRVKIDEVSDSLSQMNMPRSFVEETKKYYMQVYKMAGSVGHTGLLNDLPPTLLVRVNHEIAKNVVRRVPMFANIADAGCIDDLMVRLLPKIFLPDICLVKAGDFGSEMFFVQSGELIVLDERDDVKRVLNQGGFYGENALLRPVVRTTSVYTLTSCMLFVLAKADFLECLKEYPILSDHLDDFMFQSNHSDADDKIDDEASQSGSFMRSGRVSHRRLPLPQRSSAVTPPNSVPLKPLDNRQLSHSLTEPWQGDLQAEPITAPPHPPPPPPPGGSGNPSSGRSHDKGRPSGRKEKRPRETSELLQKADSDFTTTGSFLFGQSLQTRPTTLFKAAGSQGRVSRDDSGRSTRGGKRSTTSGGDEAPPRRDDRGASFRSDERATSTANNEMGAEPAGGGGGRPVPRAATISYTDRHRSGTRMIGSADKYRRPPPAPPHEDPAYGRDGGGTRDSQGSARDSLDDLLGKSSSSPQSLSEPTMPTVSSTPSTPNNAGAASLSAALPLTPTSQSDGALPSPHQAPE